MGLIILFYPLVTFIGFAIFYYIIKNAIKNGIREAILDLKLKKTDKGNFVICEDEDTEA